MKEGYATTFTVTAKEPCKRWELDMEDDNREENANQSQTAEYGERQLLLLSEIPVTAAV